MTRLVEAGIVAQDWNAGEHKGMVTDSVVVFIVREGNPKGIKTWDDLTKDGVEVVTPNPFTSGGARWNVMAGYGAQLEQGKTPEQAREYLRALFGNVVVQDKSARESLTTFAAGKGDVLLGYENEAIFAQRQGQPIEYVVPDETILIENPVAVTEDASEAAAGFVEFLTTRRGAEGLRRRGLPPGRRVRASTRSTSRRRPGSSRSPTSAAGTPSRRSSSTARRASWPRCSGSSGARRSRAAFPPHASGESIAEHGQRLTRRRTMTEEQRELWEQIEDVRTAMMTTIEPDGTFRSRPMWTQGDEFDGSLWFFTVRRGAEGGRARAEPARLSQLRRPGQGSLSSPSPAAPSSCTTRRRRRSSGTSSPRRGSPRAWTTRIWRCSASTSSRRSTGRTRSRRCSSSPRSCSAPSGASRRRAVRRGKLDFGS